MQVEQVQSQPFFVPWMGTEYRKDLDAFSRGKPRDGALDRVHLMGESHYSDEAASPEWTREVVMRHAANERPSIPFFTKALQIVSDGEQAIDRSAAWSRLAFSNFLQSPMTTAREKVPEEYWEQARSAFFGQLAITRPSVLICLGKRVFENLPNVGRRIPWDLAPTRSGASINDAWLYRYETEFGPQATVAVWVYHPSAPKWFRVEEARRRATGARMFYSNIMLALGEGTLFAEN